MILFNIWKHCSHKNKPKGFFFPGYLWTNYFNIKHSLSMDQYEVVSNLILIENSMDPEVINKKLVIKSNPKWVSQYDKMTHKNKLLNHFKMILEKITRANTAFLVLIMNITYPETSLKIRVSHRNGQRLDLCKEAFNRMKKALLSWPENE